MKIKLSTLLLTLALIVSLICACYPIAGDDGYRTMPLGTGTEAPAFLETEPSTEPDTESDETTLTPDFTEAPEVTDDPAISDTPDNTTSPDTSAEDTDVPAIPVTYEYDVISNTIDLGQTGGKKCQAIIRYPALTGLDDASKQEKINEYLMQSADFAYQNRLPNASELISSGNAVNYEVTSTTVTYMGNGILSVRSEGVIDHANDINDENFAYCIIISLSTGRDIALKKIYSNFGTVMNLFTSGKFKQISGDPSLTSSMSLEQLMERYKYYSQYGTFPETYFTEDSLVLIVETDRENGFFAEFSIPLDEINDCLSQSPTK